MADNVKINYDEVLPAIETAKTEIAEFEEAIAGLKNAAEIMSEQMSPDVIDELQFKIKELSQKLEEFSTENVNAAIGTMETAIYTLAEQDATSSSEVGKIE